MILRPYQHDALAGILDRFHAGDQRTLCVIPTGGGKTVVFAHLAKAFIERGLGRVIVLAHREELIAQAANKIQAIAEIKPDIEKAERFSTETGIQEFKSRIVVASVQSLVSGKGDKRRMHRFSPNEFGLCILDEAHHAPADSFTSVINYFTQNPKLKLLGVTATPDRKDGEAMGQVFQSTAYIYTLNQIITDGYLVPIRQRRVMIEGLDFSTCKTTAGDLNQGDLEQAMTFEAPLHGVAYATLEVACGLSRGALRDIADAEGRDAEFVKLLKGVQPRKTLVFATSVAHAERLDEIFRRWIPGSSEVIHGDMTDDTRREVLASFASGRVRFLVGCMVPTEGFDEPSIELVVMGRPTKSRSLYSQMVGRGCRPAESIAHTLGELMSPEDRHELIASSEKPCVEILDFVGNSGRHDLVCTADILGVEFSEEVVDAARRAAMEGCVDMQEALVLANNNAEEKKRQAEAAKKKAEEEWRRRREAQAANRAGLVATAEYSVHDADSPGYVTHPGMQFALTKGIPEKQVNILYKAKLTDEEIGRLSPEAASSLSREIVRRWRLGLASYRQARLLEKFGFTKQELHAMPFDTAKSHIDQIKSNGWKRPKVVA